MTAPSLDELRRRYREGAPPRDVVRAAIDALSSSAARAVLVGEPLAEAALADAERLAGIDPATLALYGVPFVVKDNIDVAGVATTVACPSFAYRPAADATVVQRLRAAGAIVVGKANLDQFATGLVGTRSPYGTPVNVLDPALVPGGSSSGSAVAVALGAVAFALGTDTAGSGRVPAALNGIVGLKPTRGRVSTRGVVPAVRRIDCVSVFAGSVADAGAVTAVAAGYDPGDPYSRVPRRLAGRIERVGVPTKWPEGAMPDDRSQATFDAAVKGLDALGVQLVAVDVAPLLEAGSRLYSGPLVAERFAAVGHVLDGRSDLDPSVASIIGRAPQWSAADAYLAEYRLAADVSAAAALWFDVDALALPVFTHAPTLAEVAADPLGANVRLGTFTTFVNLFDLAAIVLPSSPGPHGLQLVAPAWSDDQLVELAQSLVDGARPPAAPNAHALVVVGAHLRGQPLNRQLTDLGARFVQQTTTAPRYRLFALDATTPPKPGLERVSTGGAPIEVEVWDVPDERVGAFLAQVPHPLCIGTVELADGTWRQGFLAEPLALAHATDITAFGGWRAYRTSLT